MTNTFSVSVRFTLSVQAYNKLDAAESIRHELMLLFGEEYDYDIGVAPSLAEIQKA